MRQMPSLQAQFSKQSRLVLTHMGAVESEMSVGPHASHKELDVPQYPQPQT